MKWKKPYLSMEKVSPRLAIYVLRQWRKVNPIKGNKVLNWREHALNRESLYSYPPTVGVNLINACNIRCAWCGWSHKPAPGHLTLEDVKKMTWLRYVEKFLIWSGYGEAFLNPDFVPIFDYVRSTFPRLKIHLSTNGVLLDPSLCDRLIGRLDEFNCSLDAATSATFYKLKGSKDFDKIVSNLERIGTGGRGIGRPYFRSLSLVMVKGNINELPSFVELANRIGFNEVIFVHYISESASDRTLPKEESLYYYKEASDEMLSEALGKAKAYGIHVQAPPLFRENNPEYGPHECWEPWNSAIMAHDREGNPSLVVCCTGPMHLGIKYDRGELEPRGFLGVWNGPILRYLRRTANTVGNPLCNFCRQEDRFNPETLSTVYPQVTEEMRDAIRLLGSPTESNKGGPDLSGDDTFSHQHFVPGVFGF